LDRQAVLVDSNFLDQVTTLDTYLLLSDKVLDNDVSHGVPVGIAFAMQCVDYVERELMHRYRTVIASNCNLISTWANCSSPYPRVHFTYLT